MKLTAARFTEPTFTMELSASEVRLLNDIFDGYTGLAEMLAKEVPGRYKGKVEEMKCLFNQMRFSTHEHLERQKMAMQVFYGQKKACEFDT